MRTIAALLIIILLLGLFLFIGRDKLAAFLNNKGTELCNQNMYKEAIPFFEKALKLDPLKPLVHYNIADAYMELSMQDEAMQKFKEVIELDPEFIKAYPPLGQIYFRRKMYQESLDLLKRAENVDPSNKDIKQLINDIYFEQAVDNSNKGVDLFLEGKQKEAYALWQKALEIKPDFVPALYSLAHYYMSENKYREAESRLRKIIQIDPNFLLAYKLLGDIYYEKGDYEEASYIYRDGLSVNADDASLNNNLGSTLIFLKHYNEAVKCLERALESTPGNINVRYNLANVYRFESMFDAAIDEYEKVLESVPDYPYVHNYLGDIYLEQEKKQEAYDEYYSEINNAQNVLETSPYEASVLERLSYAYNGIGNYDQAKEIIEDAIIIQPDSRWNYLTLAKIEENLGNHSQSEEAYKKFEALGEKKNFSDANMRAVKKITGFFIDKIYLKNGSMLEGVIHTESKGRLILKVHVGSSWQIIVLKRDDIAKIIKSKESRIKRVVF